MNYRAIIYFLGLFIFPIGFLSFVNILYSIYFDYFLSIDSYVFTLIASLATGTSLVVIGRNSIKKINFYDQIILIVFVYITCSFFISLPYYLSIYQITFINALFESFSGITSTGFTIFNNIKYLDPTLILWRSSSQWIGGFYFLVFLLIIFSNKQYNFKLCHISYTGNIGSFSSENIKKFLVQLLIIYTLISLLIFILLNIGGVRLFNSLNLSMTIISNGGFLPTNFLNQIINDKNSVYLILSLFISILNIFFIFNLFSKRKIYSYHQEDLALIIFLSLLSIITIFTVSNFGYDEIIINILSSIANSGITTSVNVGSMGLFFVILTLIGGSVVSNSSGVKFIRIYILFKNAAAEILKLVRPNNVFNNSIFYSDKKLDNQIISLSFLIFISFFISIFILTSLLVLDKIDFENAFKLSILTITNTTNSELYDLQNLNFSNLFVNTKIFLIIFMIIGKIELISIFILIKKLIFRS